MELFENSLIAFHELMGDKNNLIPKIIADDVPIWGSLNTHLTTPDQQKDAVTLPDDQLTSTFG